MGNLVKNHVPKFGVFDLVAILNEPGFRKVNLSLSGFALAHRFLDAPVELHSPTVQTVLVQVVSGELHEFKLRHWLSRLVGWIGKVPPVVMPVGYTGVGGVGSKVQLFFTFPHALDGFDVSSDVLSDFFRVYEER